VDYDVIIVGAGPSGLTAAMTAASEGFSVLLVETKENIDRQTRPCCSMWLSEPGFHNETWTFKDNKIFFHRNDFSIPYSGGTVDLHRSVRVSANGNALVMGKKLMPIGRVLDKSLLLKGFLNNVQNLGVTIRTKTTCVDVEETANGIRVKLRHNGCEEWAKGKYLLACDGVDSKIVQALGMNEQRKKIMQTQILHYYFANVESPYPDAWVQFIGDGFNGVSGSMLRKPDSNGHTNIYEFAVIPPSDGSLNVSETMQRLTSHSMLKEWLTNATLIKKMGCKWTLWTPIASPAQGRIIIVGDAASFQEVENQGAIMCGYQAAKAITASEQGENGCSQYNRFWIDSFEFNAPEILKDTWKGFLFRYLGRENIDYLLSLANGKFLNGYVNHFTCTDVIWSFLKSQMPKIEKERPDLAAKIEKFEQNGLEGKSLTF